ncbi:MAG: Coenzyme F420 hydrogenase/dehydrogenase, beta subunit C-terminal domain [Bacillota bacterium]|nr:Coenzyme F420 hydrogenase/dehydrogenase, beta subunit C-terminal domain [Bacillota bacterium]
MIEIKDKGSCCGCSACFNICPQKCITMVEDNEGFLYPQVNKDKCNNCKLCEQVCPCINNKSHEEETEAYVVQNKDDDVRLESTSGGAFTAIAEHVLELGGLVYGAAYDNDFNVIHKFVSSKEELKIFRGSKYVQSSIGKSFLEIKKFLELGKKVCFSGTPCQIQGLKLFLRKDYENLITVDVVCRGVPSPKLWRKYIQFHKKNKYGYLKDVHFRDKHFGYAGSTMALYFENGKVKYSEPNVQFFKKAFFAGMSVRPSCYNCRFKTVERVSDITMFDCWKVNNYRKELDDDKGTTALIIHSNYGKELFNSIKKSLKYVKVDVNSIIQSDGDMAVKLPSKNIKRDSFFKDVDELSISELNKKYFPLSIKRCLIIIAKPILTKLKLLNVLKRKIKM